MYNVIAILAFVIYWLIESISGNQASLLSTITAILLVILIHLKFERK